MPLLLATTACSTPQTIPSEILASLAETPPGSAVRILLEDGVPAQWIIPIDLDSVPVAVRRAAEAVLQGGELVFVGQIHGGSEEAYFLEKRYPEAHTRKAIIAKDGRIGMMPARPKPDEKPKWLRVFASVDDDGPEVWSHPAIVGNRLYLRSKDEIVCLLLGK